MLPDTGVIINEPPEPDHVLLSALASKPDGTVTVTLPVKFEPDTSILVDMEAVPLVVPSGTGIPVMDKEAGGATALFIVTVGAE